MLRSILLLFVYVSFLGLGVSAPFIATLGYVWVDTFQPQTAAYIILNQIPVAFIMGAAAFFGYLALDRKSPPPLTAQTALHVGITIWVCCTMIWAQVPWAAWEKWDWAFKTLAFSAFIPFVIRSRVQIEAFAQVYVFSLAANFIPFGIKVLISGGGYGRNLGLQQGNAGLSEGGLLSTACLMAVPLALYLARHGQLLPRFKLLPAAYWATAGLAIVTAIGTYERSALVGLVALGGYMWLRTKNKVGFGIVLAIVGALVVYSASSAWDARIATVGHFEQESSAYVRILVWRWTIGFVATHPFGGGFASYLVNHVELPGTATAAPVVEFGRAFHSIYFEMLGEHGYPGLAMFLILATVTFVKLRKIAKRAKPYPELQWVIGLSDALQSGLAVFLTAGAFVGIAFQPMFWYFISMGVSLEAYMWRVERQQQATPTGWRAAAAAQVVGLPGGQPQEAGWRSRVTPPVHG